MAHRLTEAARRRIRAILEDPASYASGEPEPDAFERMMRTTRIVESLPMLVYEIEADDSGESRVTHLVGDAEAVVGATAREVVEQDARPYLDPRDLERVTSQIASAGPGGHFETAYRVAHRERGAAWTFVVGMTPDGIGHQGVVLQSDQFENLRTELEHKTRMLEAVSKSLPGALYQIRMAPDGTLTSPFCAPGIEAILGTPAEVVMEDPNVLTTYVVEEDRELLMETTLVSARDLTPWELSYRVRRSDGEVKVLWCGGVPEREPDGSTLWTSLTVDITEVARRSHEAEARTRAFFETEKLESLGRLAGGMAHDINNLLVGVLGNAELLRETTLPAHVSEIADEIALAASGCAELTRQILAFSGRGKFQSEPVDLRRLVGETVRLARAAISGPEPTLDLGDRSMVVRGDPTQLRQVILNLVTNALQASSQFAVAVRARVVSRSDAHATLAAANGAADHFVKIEIEDKGDGILPVHRSRIFEPYFTTRPDGRGLGLASALGIVRNHDGVLTFESTPGAGTTFEVWLPLVPEVPLSEPKATGDAPSLEGLRVLVVDDQPEVMGMTSRMLQHRGAVARGLTDPRRVLAVLETDAFDLLVLDLTMPELPGTELFEAVRARHADLPVVLYSGYTERALRDLASASRVTYLQKPFTAAQLVEAAHRAIGSSPQRRE